MRVFVHPVCKLVRQVADKCTETSGIGASDQRCRHRSFTGDRRALFDGARGTVIGHPRDKLVVEDDGTSMILDGVGIPAQGIDIVDDRLGLRLPEVEIIGRCVKESDVAVALVVKLERNRLYLLQQPETIVRCSPVNVVAGSLELGLHGLTALAPYDCIQSCKVPGERRRAGAVALHCLLPNDS